MPAPAVVAEERAKVRRRRKAKNDMLGRGHEYMDLEDDFVPSRVEPSGLTALAGDAFGGGATTPLTPGSWASQYREQVT